MTSLETWSLIGDFAAILIAIIAIGLTVMQVRATQTHNMLSLRPHLKFDTLYNQVSPQIKIILSNCGVGPAYIKSYEVTLDGEPFSGTMIDLTKQLELPRYYSGGIVLGDKDAIRQGETIDALVLRTTEEEIDSSFDNEKAHEEISRLNIVVEFTSAYKEIGSIELKTHNKQINQGQG